MGPLFVDSQSAFLFTSLLLVGPNSQTVDLWSRALVRQWYYYCVLKACTAVVVLTAAKSKDVHAMALSCGAHACVAKDHFVSSALHHIVQNANKYAWQCRLQARA